LLHFGLIGLIVGLAQATKEISPLYFGLAGLALWATRPQHDKAWSANRCIAAALGFVVPYLLFYSSFGSNPSGLLDGFRSYFLQAERLSDNRHDYPWWYHLRYLGLVPSGGPNWGQYLLLALGLVGGIQALFKSASRAHRVVAILTFGLLVIHSIVSYKTPWLLLTPVIGLVLLAAEFLAKLLKYSKRGILAVAVILPLTMAQSFAKSSLALDRYPGDVRNPYFYEQAPRGLLRLPARIEQLQVAQSEPLRVAIVSPEHAWPLPWYLRHQQQIGYFTEPPPNLTDWDIVVWDDQMGEAPDPLMNYPVGEIYSLRPNVMLFVYIAGPTWERVFPPLTDN